MGPLEGVGFEEEEAVSWVPLDQFGLLWVLGGIVGDRFAAEDDSVERGAHCGRVRFEIRVDEELEEAFRGVRVLAGRRRVVVVVVVVEGEVAEGEGVVRVVHLWDWVVFDVVHFFS